MALVVAVGPAWAQNTAPDDARFQVGPLAATPVIQLTNVGRDDNVFRDVEGEQQDDFTATLRPSVDAWLRLPMLQANGRAAVDFVYFKDLSDLRSVDTVNNVRVELLLNRLLPFVQGDWSSTRHQLNEEIDLPIRRVSQRTTVGTGVRLTGKLTLGAQASRSTQDWKGDTDYLGNNLESYLNNEITGEAAFVRYALTPLTTIGITVARERARFDLVPERNADSTLVMPEVTFQPFALVSGRARVGFRSRKFLDGRAEEYGGSTADVDLTYTLLGRTQFNVGLARDLAYSYDAQRRDYLLTGLDLIVTQRVAGLWDVQGIFGRSLLSYSAVFSEGSLAGSEEEIISNYGAGVVYRANRAQLGVRIEHVDRRSNFNERRDYDRLRVTSSVTYGF
jgi:hypothetical protein